MDADGGREPGVAFGQADDRPAGGQVEARHEDVGDPDQGGAFQDGRPIGVEIFQIQMAVGVSQYHASGYLMPGATVFDDTRNRNT